MSRAVQPRLTTKLVRQHAVLNALGVSKRSFWRKWHRVFTDPRCPQDKHRGVERKVYEDELVAAVSEGGGTRAVAAVLAFRGLMGRVDK
jgi:hypothetical protein